MNDGFRILERSNALFRILECPEYFVRLSLFMNNGTKDRTNYSGYRRIRNDSFDLWVSGSYECRFPYTKKIEQNIRDTQVYGIFRSTFVAMNNGLKERMNSSGYSRIRNNAFDLWVSGDYECCFPYTTMIERNIRDTRVSRIFRSTLLSMNNGYKDRMNSSGYSRIRNNAFDV